VLLPQDHLIIMALSLLLEFYLSKIKDLGNLQCVCKGMHRLVTQDEELWRALLVQDFECRDNTVTANQGYKRKNGNQFLEIYKEEYNISHCNGLGIKLQWEYEAGIAKITDRPGGMTLKKFVGEVSFTTTLVNRTNQTLKVFSCGTVGSDGLTAGNAFRQKNMLLPDQKSYYVGSDFLVCGNYGDYFHILEAKERKKIQTIGYILRVTGKSMNLLPRYVLLFEGGECFELGIVKGPFQLYVELVGDTELTNPTHDNKDMWKGKVRSNIVTVNFSWPKK